LRTTSQIWVSAFLRSQFARGGYAAVVRRGAAEAGAIFLVRRHTTGKCDLFGPAPQSTFTAETSGERMFERVLEGGDESALAAQLERQVRFDADLWIVEFEGNFVPQLLAEPRPEGGR